MTQFLRARDVGGLAPLGDFASQDFDILAAYSLQKLFVENRGDLRRLTFVPAK